MKVKEESENVGLKVNIQKTKIMESGPITSWEKMGKQWGKVSDFIFWGPKSLQMIAAMKNFQEYIKCLMKRTWSVDGSVTVKDLNRAISCEHSLSFDHVLLILTLSPQKPRMLSSTLCESQLRKKSKYKLKSL